MINSNTHRCYDTPESRWAGVGPYYAMFPIAFADQVIREYTKPGDWVLDPFAGRGTALFSAATQGRFGLGFEINPVGWVYGKAKLQTADREEVENLICKLGENASHFRAEASALPEFYQLCFSRDVLKFLVAARNILDWRRKKADRTAMALILIDLHGKRENSLSNQMRQTKAMSPHYAIRWWKERELIPPERNPVEFMLKKIAWRYAKGRLEIEKSRFYLGDNRFQLNRLSNSFLMTDCNVKLLLTSPPYYNITNYFYDQWLRLWLLGGSPMPKSSGVQCKNKFQNKNQYRKMLHSVLIKSKRFLSIDAVIYVRTDARNFTLETTLQTLEEVFQNKKIRNTIHTSPIFSQTLLFQSGFDTKGEVDIVMW